MAIWLINPAKRRKPKLNVRSGRMAKAKRKSTRRPSAKQLAARRKFAAMARARSKAARSSPRKRRARPMARKKARRTRRRTGIMRSVKRGGHAVSRASWRASGYRRNPRRRRSSVRRVKRRSFRRNPGFGGGIGREVFALAKNTLAVMAGGVLGRTVAGAIPFGNSADPKTAAIMDAGKGVLVAVAIKRFGRRVVSADLAEMIAIGALLQPLRNLAITLVPQSAQFLSGSMAFPSFPGGVGSYAAYAADGSLDIGNTGGGDIGGGLGAYSQEWGGATGGM